MRSFLAIVLFVALDRLPAVASPSQLIDQADTKLVVPEGAETLLCGRASKNATKAKPAPSWPKAAKHPARFLLKASGQLEVEPSASPTTIAFHGTQNAYAIVETDPTNGGPPEVLACGPVKNDATYDLAGNKLKTGAMLSVRLFDEVTDKAKYLVEYRRKVLEFFERNLAGMSRNSDS